MRGAGKNNLKTVYFCHGLPGSAADSGLLAKANPILNIIPLELLKFQPQDIVQALSEARDMAGEPTKPGGVHLVGFSIGAMAAIKIAAFDPEQVSKLTLISPAAPLQLGTFLEDMAGKPIFEMAMKRPGVLALVTRVQGQIAKLSPSLMTRVLFSACGPCERALLDDPSFRRALNDGFHSSFAKHRQTYLAYVKDYVADWRSELDKLECPVDVWHGTADTWSPLDMSVALKARIGENCTLHKVENAEHYSTLSHVRLLPAQGQDT